MTALKRTRLSPEDRKDAMVSAALVLAEAQGFYNFSSTQVARACGCGHPLIFHHFEGMEGLRDEVMLKAIVEGNLNVVAQGLVSKHPLAVGAPDALKKKALKNI